MLRALELDSTSALNYKNYWRNGADLVVVGSESRN